MLEDAGKFPVGETKEDEEIAKQIFIKKTPLGVSWVQSEDIAAAVVFLASGAARMVSEAAYDVTAGDKRSLFLGLVCQ